MKTIFLTGNPLDFSALEKIGSGHVVPVVSDHSYARVDAAHTVIADRIAMGLPVYGANTGVGSMKDRLWTVDDLAEFNTALVKAHHFGTGPLFSKAIVRKAIAIRINTALGGHTGCSVDLVKAFLALLERGVVPAVHRHGSIGCADIGLMGQVASVLTGTGQAFF
ncbi:MAG TPA: aromatic amino acid lyase, partial [Pararhizobium sp.]|uniref:aromatic amino acid lyase n=1 Tax=Pararhizobium sp. TaxID=1977563 RepID=UPI002D016880